MWTHVPFTHPLPFYGYGITPCLGYGVTIYGYGVTPFLGYGITLV